MPFVIGTKWILILGALVLLVLPSREAFGQAWVRDGGGYFFKLAGSYLFATEEYNYQGDLQPIFGDFIARNDAWFRDVSITSYLEYGITNDVTFVFNLPFKILTTREIESLGIGLPQREIIRENAGLGDLTTSLRYPLLRRNSFVTSVQAGVKIPMGYEKTPDNGGAPLGTGEVDVEGHLFAGISLWPVPGYLSGGIGYRVRGGPLHDEIPFYGEGGYTIKERVFMKVRLEGLKNTVAPPDLGTADNNVIVGDQDWLKLMPTASVRVLKGTWVTLEAFHVLAGKNTVAGTTWQAAVEFVR